MRKVFCSIALGGMLIALIGASGISASPEQKKERSEIVCVRKRDQGKTANSNGSQTAGHLEHSSKARS